MPQDSQLVCFVIMGIWQWGYVSRPEEMLSFVPLSSVIWFLVPVVRGIHERNFMRDEPDISIISIGYGCLAWLLSAVTGTVLAPNGFRGVFSNEWKATARRAAGFIPAVWTGINPAARCSCRISFVTQNALKTIWC